MREFIRDCRTIGFWRYVWGMTGYRPTMRLAHRFGWHHAPRNPWLTNDAGWALHRCSWCGLSGFVATKEDLERGPLRREVPIAGLPEGPKARSSSNPPLPTPKA